MSLPKVNAVVVGSGAGGAVAAKCLSAAGLRVVLLERGPQVNAGQATHDILHSQYDTSGELGCGPALAANPRTYRLTPEQRARRIYPNQGGYGRTAACTGGGTPPYGCMAWRFAEKDFRLKSLYGVPAGTTVEDWPISYQDLEPYYTQAEYEIGISGRAGANPFEAPRSQPYPLPPLPYDRGGRVFARGARALGLHPFPLPLAILSRPYDGRPACIHCNACERFLCEVNAKSAMHATLIPKALATGLCELRTGCMARELRVDARGRARAVAYHGPDGQLQEQPADLVIVACSATETCRLLLNSKSKLFPEGLANRQGQVGRHIMDHTGGAGLPGFFAQPIYQPSGPGFTAAVADFVHARGAPLNGSMIATMAELRQPLAFAENCGGRFGTHPWGLRAKQFVRHYFRRTVGLYAPGIGLPTENNRVDLDPEVRDAWGIPVLRVTHRAHPLEVRSSYFFRNRMIEILRAAGAIEALLPRPASEAEIERAASHIRWGGLGEHQVGGCRMGRDPKTSVLNANCQAHEVENLFVADGSSFPSIGGFNPSLTIQANAYRVSAYIAREWRGGAFRT